VFNATRDGAEKLNHSRVTQGATARGAAAPAGDIGCVAKLRNTHTNDTLSTARPPCAAAADRVPEPLVQMAISPVNRARRGEAAGGTSTGFTTRIRASSRTGAPRPHETLVTGLGERHLEVVLAKLEAEVRRRGRAASPAHRLSRDDPRRAEGQGRHKKQSGATGQFGDCWVRIAPVPRGSGFRVRGTRSSAARSRASSFPPVERGIIEASERGVLAGYPLVDFKVELFDGSYHTVDSNEMSFKMAGILAFKTVAPKCKPVLLEPLDEVDVIIPDDCLGDVLGDLSARRAQILGTEPAPADMRGTRVRAIVPQSELHLYASALQSMTTGAPASGASSRATRRCRRSGAARDHRDASGAGGHRRGALARGPTAVPDY
jgi:elongation factor G